MLFVKEMTIGVTKKNLQKQFDEMEKNPNAVLCTTKVRCISESGNELEEYLPRKDISSKILFFECYDERKVEQK